MACPAEQGRAEREPADSSYRSEDRSRCSWVWAKPSEIRGAGVKAGNLRNVAQVIFDSGHRRRRGRGRTQPLLAVAPGNFRSETFGRKWPGRLLVLLRRVSGHEWLGATKRWSRASGLQGGSLGGRLRRFRPPARDPQESCRKRSNPRVRRVHQRAAGRDGPTPRDDAGGSEGDRRIWRREGGEVRGDLVGGDPRVGGCT